MNSDNLRQLKHLKRRIFLFMNPPLDSDADNGAALNPSLLSRLISSPSYPASYIRYRVAPKVGVGFTRPVPPLVTRILKTAGIAILPLRNRARANLDFKFIIQVPYDESLSQDQLDAALIDTLTRTFGFKPSRPRAL
jgi:hypothetical protein